MSDLTQVYAQCLGGPRTPIGNLKAEHEMELLRVVTPEEPCPYLREEQASFDVRVIEGISPAHYAKLLERGWRRFGSQFFRPVCHNCLKCRSLRIHVPEFSPNRSQKRCLGANLDVDVFVTKPQMNQEHLALFERYHSNMADLRGWPAKVVEESTYWESFGQGAGKFGFEFQYKLEGRLVGVALTDIVQDSMSSVYFYHEPSLRSRGLGILSILRQLKYCTTNGIEYLHLGFWVEENGSMRYKAQFKPHEILQGRPSEVESPVWIRQTGT